MDILDLRQHKRGKYHIQFHLHMNHNDNNDSKYHTCKNLVSCVTLTCIKSTISEICQKSQVDLPQVLLWGISSWHWKSSTSWSPSDSKSIVSDCITSSMMLKSGGNSSSALSEAFPSVACWVLNLELETRRRVEKIIRIGCAGFRDVIWMHNKKIGHAKTLRKQEEFSVELSNLQVDETTQCNEHTCKLNDANEYCANQYNQVQLNDLPPNALVHWRGKNLYLQVD